MSAPDEFTVGYICTDINALTSCVISLDEEHSPLPQTRHDGNTYEFGKIGSRNIAMCCVPLESGSGLGTVAVDMMHSFPSIKLLILVSSNAGTVPRDVGQVHVGDVVVAQKFVKTNPYGDLVEIDLLASGLLATAGMDTGEQWSLDQDIAILAAKNNRWGGKCRRPAGDDVDKLDRIFTPRRQDEPASMAHRHGLVISDPTYPEHAGFRDSVAGPGTFESTSAVCFDHGQTAGLPLNKEVVDEVSVLGVSNYCDEDTQRDQNMWTRYASMAAAACARKIVMRLATETKQDGRAMHTSTRIPLL
ncbi:hypothetical protein BDV35DRAFT_375132 [Aspergillus flavus]|uniref:Nucleoside phosphorylase domain-containing protein n=1 Tax=Aspergillus flavus TaxID=5059 RepID=A0A5N6GD52_ASPFL|nr:hypothetical protein BDV35DRAFT_375132 [Aspergillus flavus]